ncbi:hypothetical protein ACOME3_006301 [Neoechinorhynchus agilis]
MDKSYNPVHNWELNDSQEDRSPIPLSVPLRDPSDSQIQRLAQTEFRCPICLDILRTAMAAKECLHRFCLDCITTALRAGNKECPSCRKKLVSRRSLRHDVLFDNLIEILFPDRSGREDLAVEPDGHQLPNTEDTDVATSDSPRKRRKTRSSMSIEVATPPTAATTTTTKRRRAPKVDARIYPCEACKLPIVCSRLSRSHDDVKFIKTQVNATVGHLRRYLRRTLDIESDEEGDADQKVKILIKMSNQMIELTDDESELVAIGQGGEDTKNKEIKVFFDVDA